MGQTPVPSFCEGKTHPQARGNPSGLPGRRRWAPQAVASTGMGVPVGEEEGLPPIQGLAWIPTPDAPHQDSRSPGTPGGIPVAPAVLKTPRVGKVQAPWVFTGQTSQAGCLLVVATAHTPRAPLSGDPHFWNPAKATTDPRGGVPADS